MTDKDRLTLEEPEKMCDYCCNFDKEHVGMDGTALCKLTMTLAYAEDYSGNCMFYNVPKEQIIIPPCKVGDTVYTIFEGDIETITVIRSYREESINGFNTSYDARNNFLAICFSEISIGKTVFLTKEEAEEKLKELGK